jgi:metallo-beta-lactamase class B
LKAEEFSNLGNIAEANLKEWARSINKVIEKFSAAEVVIPGHGIWGDKKLLQHTLDLLSEK